MTVLNREAILGVSLKRVEVDVPAWGGSVFVRELRAKDQPALLALRKKEDSNHDMLVEAILLSVIDENGNRIFQDTDEDRKFISEGSHSTYEKLAKVIADLNEFNVEDEEAEENFLNAPAESSPSD